MTQKPPQQNLLNKPLVDCCTDPMTGFYRDGKCSTGANDLGRHTVCSVMTKEFLEYTKAKGNDLSTPRPEFGFPGLKPGDGWCLCATRWYEAYREGVAPPVKPESTNIATLDIVPKEALLECSVQ